MDFQVDYDNHTLFRGDVKKHGSPVRIFTNIHPQKIKLSAVEGYRYKILLPFLWETFFLSISTFEKKVKMSSISRLKIRLTLYILCMVIHVLPFYGMMGGKYMHMYKYVRVWLCIFMYNYMHVHVYWWCNDIDSYSVIIIF